MWRFTRASPRGGGAGPSPKLQVEVCVSLEAYSKKKEKEKERKRDKERKKKKQLKKKKAKHTAWLSNIRFLGVLLVEAGCPLEVSQESSQWSTAWPCLA